MISGRVAFFIDGFNIYHSMDEDPSLHKYKWLDLYKLCRILIPRKCSISKVHWFTAYTTWNPKKLSRHQNYARLLQTTPVEIVLGKFKDKDVYCRLCKRTSRTVIEKQTDVNIAIKLFQNGIQDLYDTAVIISGDSDLVPSIRAAKETFPVKQIGVAFPIGRVSKELKQVSDFSVKLGIHHLKTCQFPDRVEVRTGVFLERPTNYF